MSRFTALLLGIALSAGAGAQTLHTYTEFESGSQKLPLGYPVPLPVASLTPVDGFRDYASLEARLQSLALAHDEIDAHAVGSSIHGRSVWAYSVGRDSLDVEGRSRAAFFINATTHAREWAAPEVATGLVERFASGVDDGGLVRYLLDNTRLLIIPVHNVDGLQQTQRYPTEVLIGQDPCSASSWPRDGRMRRKNMRGADQLLHTTGDHRAGVDLNRNHPPLWRTAATASGCSSGSSSDPNNLVFHGAAAHSEPENQALLQAAALAPASRIRLGIDVHSHARVFFSSNTGRARLNAIQRRLLALLSAHHSAQPTHDRAVNGVLYRDVPDPPNRGIGAAAEYFAYEWLVPAWTLEIEPSSGGQDYGGFGVSHDGFILPASQIRRVREGWAESHLLAFYFMAGPPHLARLRLYDADSGALLRERRWRYNAISQRRELLDTLQTPIAPGSRVRAEFAFNKPMRHRVDGQIANLPGRAITLAPTLRLIGASGEPTPLDSSAGQWLAAPGLRYRDDSFVVEFDAPAAPFAIEVETSDMVGLALDADPSTPVDWAAGAWSGWQNAAGSDGDQGGADRLSAAIGAAGSGIELLAPPTVVGEGDRLRLRLRRHSADDQPLRIVAESPEQAYLRTIVSPPPPAPEVQWAAGETGERELQVPVADDIQPQGERPWTVSLSRLSGDSVQAFAELALTVLDNDRDDVHVLHVQQDLPAALALLGQSTAADRSLLLDGDRAYPTAAESQLTVCRPPLLLPAPLRLYGSGARLTLPDACSGVPTASGDAQEVMLRGIVSPQFEVASGARARISQSEIGRLRVDGRLDVSRSVLGSAQLRGGELQLQASTLVAGDAPLLQLQSSGQATLQSVSLLGAGGLLTAPVGSGVELAGSLLQQPAGAAVSACTGSLSALVSVGFNLASDASCALTAGGDRQNLRLPGFEGAASAPQPPSGAAIDGGATACGEVDQQGAPRPQSADSSASVRCDIGAIERGINPFRGLWNLQRDGHGVELQTAGRQIFITWYSYDSNGEPTAFQASGPLTGPRWRAVLTQPRRDASGAIVYSEVGSVGIDFDSNTEARLSWRFGNGAEGSEPMQAFVFAAAEPRVEVSGHWFPPAESGNGASVLRRGEVTGILLYYYDAAGDLRWALGTGGAGDAVELQMLSFAGFCPDCDAATMPVSHRPIGRVLLHFLTPERLRVDSDLQYPGPAGGHWLRERAMFVPISEPVDNRHPLRQEETM